MEGAAKGWVDGSYIVQRAVEALDSATVHLLVQAVAAVHSNYRRLASALLTVGRWSTPCLTPIGRQPLGMPRMQAMTERVCHDLVGHDALMPCLGETEDGLRASNGFK